MSTTAEPQPLAAVTLKKKWQLSTSALPVTTGRLEVGCCLALGPLSNRRGAEYQNAAYKHNGCCRLHGGLSTGARTQQGLQRISEANLKHGRQTKDKLAAQRHAAAVGRRVMGELKRIQRQIVDAGLMPEQSDDFKAASSARVRSKQPVEAVFGHPIIGQCRLARLGMERREAQNTFSSRHSWGCLDRKDVSGL